MFLGWSAKAAGPQQGFQAQMPKASASGSSEQTDLHDDCTNE
jgi:hypothetical protein